MSSNSTASISNNTAHLSVPSSDRGSKCCLSKKAFITALAVSTVFAAALVVGMTCILTLHNFGVITLPLWACIGVASIDGLAGLYVGAGALILVHLRKLEVRSRRLKEASQYAKVIKAYNRLLTKCKLEMNGWVAPLLTADNAMQIEIKKNHLQIKKFKRQVTQSSSSQEGDSYDVHSKASPNQDAKSANRLHKGLICGLQKMVYMANNYPMLPRHISVKDVLSHTSALIKHHTDTEKVVEQVLALVHARVKER